MSLKGYPEPGRVIVVAGISNLYGALCVRDGKIADFALRIGTRTGSYEVSYCDACFADVQSTITKVALTKPKKGVKH